jgi:hypothetical protein
MPRYIQYIQYMHDLYRKDIRRKEEKKRRREEEKKGRKEDMTTGTGVT